MAVIGYGQFRANIAQAAEVLSQAKLLDRKIPFVPYDSTLPSKVRKLSYVDEYSLYVRERLYDFLLTDNALLQFRLDESTGFLSYCYYQAPYELPPYEQFVTDMFPDEDVSLEEIGDAFREEYDLATSTARLRNSATPLRYDYSPTLYKPCVHPAAHMHIGSGNDIRLPTRRVMLPLSFTMFVVRQMYPLQWRNYLEKSDAATIRRAIRDDLPLVDDKYHTTADRLQLIFE